MPEMNRNTLMKALPFAAALLVMGVSCYYQGIWSERWSEFPELEVYSEQLQKVPMKVGEWDGVDNGESDERVKLIAGISGEINRTYTNAAGEEVRLMMMCARFQDIFNHSPEVCYPAAGFEMQSEPQREVFEIDGDTTAQFFTTTFLKSEPSGTRSERGFWSWSADGEWLAPTNPKVSMAGERVLYKMYVFGNVANDSERSDHDFCANFIRAFVPAAKTALRPGFEKVKRLREGDEAGTPPEATAAADVAG